MGWVVGSQWHWERKEGVQGAWQGLTWAGVMLGERRPGSVGGGTSIIWVFPSPGSTSPVLISCSVKWVVLTVSPPEGEENPHYAEHVASRKQIRWGRMEVN